MAKDHSFAAQIPKRSAAYELIQRDGRAGRRVERPGISRERLLGERAQNAYAFPGLVVPFPVACLPPLFRHFSFSVGGRIAALSSGQAIQAEQVPDDVASRVVVSE
jgi:hypothetical protein